METLLELMSTTSIMPQDIPKGIRFNGYKNNYDCGDSNCPGFGDCDCSTDCDCKTDCACSPD
jgi:hypothetical protein